MIAAVHDFKIATEDSRSALAAIFDLEEAGLGPTTVTDQEGDPVTREELFLLMREPPDMSGSNGRFRGQR